MSFSSDTLKIGPVSGGDRQTMADLASSLGILSEGEGDYIIIGPMSAGDRTTIANKAQSLGLGCVDYYAPEQPSYSDQVNVDLTSVEEKLSNVEAKINTIISNQELFKEDFSNFMNKISSIGKAMQ